MQCHAFGMGGAQRIDWPDGRSTLEQPALTVTMFTLIGDEFGKEVEATSQQP